MALVLALVASGCAGTVEAGPDMDEANPARVEAAAAAAPAPDPRGADVVILAMNYIDTRYRYGGTSQEQGFDCSGFTRHVFEQGFGLTLPRTADDQAGAAGLRRVRRDDLQPGDLVFFNTLRRTYSHVGIYVGEGRFIHAPRTGAAVRIEAMSLPYWKSRYSGARRAAAPG